MMLNPNQRTKMEEACKRACCILWLAHSFSVSTQAQGKLEKLGEGERDGGKGATEHLAGAGGKPHSAAAASGANSEKKTSGKGIM